jgi:type I restriction enzyme S subunit
LLRLHPDINPAFVSHFLSYAYRRGEFNEFQTETTNLRNLNVADFLEKTELPLAPSAEQRRITAKLEKVLGKVDDCQKRLAKIPMLLKRFRQSVLAAACSGRLTTDWRESNPQAESADDLIRQTSHAREVRYEQLCSEARSGRDRKPPPFNNLMPNLRIDLGTAEVPDTWQWVDLRFMMSPEEPFCYGVVQPGSDDFEGVFLIRAGDLNGGRVELASLRRIPRSVHAQYPRSCLRGGEVLITVVGAGIGEAAIAQSECAGFNVARAVAKLPIREFSAKYVYYWLCTNQAVLWMKGDSREVARPTLNLEQLQTLPVPLPPIAEQPEIVQRVETLFALADHIESRYAKAKAHVDKLTQSILAKAFRGELVPQDPADEPASVLLERIKAESAKSGAGKKGKGELSSRSRVHDSLIKLK